MADSPSEVITPLDSYLDPACQGKNTFWRYFSSVLLILVLWQILGAMPYVILLVWFAFTGKIQSLGDASNLAAIAPLPNFIALILADVFFFLAIFLAVRFIHRRPFLSLITPTRSIAWGRILQGFGVWFFLSAVASLLEALLYPGRYSWSFSAGLFIPFLILAVILVPIQTSSEELFFRAYLLQGIGLRVRNIWVLSAISGFLFMLPHLLNPEASANYPLLALFYFSMGFFLAYMTLRDGRLELALGVHAANNLFSFVIANSKVTVLPTPSLFTVNVIDAFYSVPAGIICMVLFIILFFVVLRQKS